MIAQEPRRFEVHESGDNTLVLGVELQRVSDTGRSIAFVLTQNTETGKFSLEVEYEEDGIGEIIGGFDVDKTTFEGLKEGKLIYAYP